MNTVPLQTRPWPSALPEHLGAQREPGAPGEVRLRLTPLAFERAARMLRDAGARFVTIFLADTPEPALVAAFALRGDLVALRAPTGGAQPVTYGSLAGFWPATRWAE
jgi:hypothetical protein